MNTSEAIKKELKNLLENQEDFVNLAKDNMDILEFGTSHQHWYSRAYTLIKYLAVDRLSEFASYYLIDPKWKIQLLADIRNLCRHQKALEPTDEQVDELISGINAAIKSIF
jgi:hypothetical protein